MKFYLKVLYRIALWSSILGIIAFIFDFGYAHSESDQLLLDEFYLYVLGIGVVSTLMRYIDRKSIPKRSVFIFDVLSLLLTILIFYVFLSSGDTFKNTEILQHPIWIKLAVILSFIREFSEIHLNFRRTFLNPAQLFVVSFFLIIFFGALLLMLPKATYEGISAIDALFTSTSAVCVTGLIVVDTGSYFTEFGQLIILGLIQLGGLGILTFASYFSYFFKGGSTYENQLVLTDLTNSNKIGEVFSTLKYIILVTFSIELLSAILIFLNLDPRVFHSGYNRLFFSIFHSISAFCNAGFSTLPNGLYETGFRFNYGLQLVIILTFFIGGLGFPIVSNLLKYIKYKIKKLLKGSQADLNHRPWILHINSRITLITTISITVFAFLLFYTLEYNNTLKIHSGFGKVVTALFGATTPRTAGFNTIDTASMLFPTTMMVFLLMWIGASPSSTGGGIKTSTFAIATLNILSLAKGKTRIEVFRRQIADISVRRAFAIISLSFIVIGLGTILITIFDSDKDLLSISFECFSAYSTVGLSLGITSKLSVYSKLVLMGVMFVGRVSMLTIIIAIFKKVKHKNYRYPTEEIAIN